MWEMWEIPSFDQANQSKSLSWSQNYGQQDRLLLFKNFYISIGEESFEHANVLSEKINFSALGGPGVAIFGPDDLHPMC